MKPRGRKDNSILHVDMDAFFAAVEQRDQPELRGKPVAVGGASSERGVVSAASYEARRFGVKSAMPMARAKRLCPTLVVIPGDHTRYQAESARIMEIFQSYSPLVEPLSLDEAFIDLAGTRGLFGPPAEVAVQIKLRIREERNLVASVGVAASKLVAKIASDLDKPDGLVVVPAGDEEVFLSPLPVERIFGIGKRAAEQLHKFGIRRIRDLAELDERILDRIFGQRGRELALLARGIDPRPVVPFHQPKGHSRERTFREDLTDQGEMERILLDFADQVSWELRCQGYLGQEVKLKLRDHQFQTITRSRKLAAPTDLATPLYRTGLELFRALGDLPPIRLLGLGMSGLVRREEPGQGSLFPHTGVEQEKRLTNSIDLIRAKYGHRSIRPGRLLNDEEPPTQ